MTEKTIVFKRFRLNPDALRKRGVSTQIVGLSMGGGEIAITFAKQPSRGEIERIVQLLRQDRWEVIEE